MSENEGDVPLAGEQLRRIRMRRQMTQGEMAKLLKCNPGNYSSMEIGARGIPERVRRELEANQIFIVQPDRWRR